MKKIIICLTFVFLMFLPGAAFAEGVDMSTPEQQETTLDEQMGFFERTKNAIVEVGINIAVIALLMAGIVFFFSPGLGKKVLIGTIIGLILLAGGFEFIIAFFKHIFSF